MIVIIDNQKRNITKPLRDSQLLLRVLDGENTPRVRTLAGYKPIIGGITPDSPAKIINVRFYKVLQGYSQAFYYSKSVHTTDSLNSTEPRLSYEQTDASSILPINFTQNDINTSQNNDDIRNLMPYTHLLKGRQIDKAW